MTDDANAGETAEAVADGVAERPADEGETEPSALAERVAEYDEELADAVDALAEERDALAERVETLHERNEELEDELEDRTDRLQRTQAEFQNYKKRMDKRREELEARATEELVEELLDVRDNLTRALESEGDIREGVEATLRSFDEVLAAEDVERIEPDPGSEVDPHRHEVLVRVDSDQPADAVAEVYRPGYEMAGSVIRPAQVTVSDTAEE